MSENTMTPLLIKLRKNLFDNGLLPSIDAEIEGSLSNGQLLSRLKRITPESSGIVEECAEELPEDDV